MVREGVVPLAIAPHRSQVNHSRLAENLQEHLEKSIEDAAEWGFGRESGMQRYCGSVLGRQSQYYSSEYE